MVAEAIPKLPPDLINPNWGNSYWPWVIVALSAVAFVWQMLIALRKPPELKSDCHTVNPQPANDSVRLSGR